MIENIAVMNAILEKIRSYRRIVISRHKRPDGDAVGSTMGLQRILRLSFPEKEILLTAEDTSERMAFFEKEDPQPSDSFYREALLIVLDTANWERVSNAKRGLAREVVKIDHHIDNAPYGDISWVEEGRSSVCEMIAALAAAFPGTLKMDRTAAAFLYTGLVTDSGRFQYSSTGGDTMRLAGYLLDFGIDTDWLYAQLDLNDFSYLRYKSWVYQNVQMTENGVLYLYISLETQRAFGLSREEASSAVGFMDSVRGGLIWLAFIEYADRSVRVRLRSRFAEVSTIAEHYRGGGHANASGATVYSREEADALIAEADAELKAYKASHDGWL